LDNFTRKNVLHENRVEHSFWECFVQIGCGGFVTDQLTASHVSVFQAKRCLKQEISHSNKPPLRPNFLSIFWPEIDYSITIESELLVKDNTDTYYGQAIL